MDRQTAIHKAKSAHFPFLDVAQNAHKTWFLGEDSLSFKSGISGYNRRGGGKSHIFRVEILLAMEMLPWI